MAKNFNEFLSGFQEIHFKLMADKINEMQIKVTFPITENNFNDLVTKICAVNSLITFEILEAYHDWISRKD